MGQRGVAPHVASRACPMLRNSETQQKNGNQTNQNPRLSHVEFPPNPVQRIHISPTNLCYKKSARIIVYGLLGYPQLFGQLIRIDIPLRLSYYSLPA